MIRRLMAALLVAMLGAPTLASAQANGDIWRAFAQKLEAGTSVVVRLQNGQRFKATLIDVGGLPCALTTAPELQKMPRNY